LGGLFNTTLEALLNHQHSRWFSNIQKKLIFPMKNQFFLQAYTISLITLKYQEKLTSFTL
ncbi:hypothetical protein P7D77_21485, partial [Enterococcus avium]|uniref:hypothetical protein n=1 Tax=Enterococcus avium TaxID=33945 RepID=UPI00288FFCAD